MNRTLESTPFESDHAALHQGIRRRVTRRMSASGAFVLSSAPSLLESHFALLVDQFDLVGRGPSEDEAQTLRAILVDKLAEAFAISPMTRVRVDWRTQDADGDGLTFDISTVPLTMEDEYEDWAQHREAPLFGHHPDARVMDVARELGVPADVPCLDIGAGTGRNTLPLARLGHPADAVEAAPALARLFREAAAAEDLTVGLIEGDALGAELVLPANHYALVFLCEVVSHFRSVAQVRALFERAHATLRPGGVLLFSAFIAHDGYEPDALERDISEVFWSSIFTRDQLREAMHGLDFTEPTDRSVHDYEREHLPEAFWPPTGWFEGWSRGCDVFDVPNPPMELRWVECRKR